MSPIPKKQRPSGGSSPAAYAAYADEHLGATGLANRLNGAGLRNRGDRLWSNQTVLRVLRNTVYVGKISHGDEVYDGKHPSIVDGDLFARAQALLDERAALVENRAPNTSEYLLTGMLRCRACGDAYFGAGTKGRNGFYHYYARRNRQTKGTYGCQSKRVPAEDLETAVIDDLIETLSRSDLFEQAITAAIADLADDRPSLEAELTSTEAQLRDTETGLNHYLRAFETGEMPAALCSPRVTELTQRRDELVAHRKDLARRLEAASPQLPTPEQLRALCAEIRRTIDSGNPDAAKQLLRELIDRVEITPDRHAYPYFWVPAGCETGTSSGKPGPDAPPVPSRQEDTGWLFVTSGGVALSVFELRPTARPAPQSHRRTMSADWLGTRSRSAGHPIVEVHEAHDELHPERFGDLVEGRQAGGHVAGLEARDGGLGRAETLGELALAQPPLLPELVDLHREPDRPPSALVAAVASRRVGPLPFHLVPVLARHSSSSTVCPSAMQVCIALHARWTSRRSRWRVFTNTVSSTILRPVAM